MPSYLDLIFVARAFERVGDNTTNIAEDNIVGLSVELSVLQLERYPMICETRHH
jgi:phosphate uptake regulator